jgi:peptide/nickel transport system permease protein
MIGLVVVIISSAIGMLLGLLAGYYRWARAPIMRVMDALMAFPMVLLMMTIAALLGGGIRNAIIALSVGMVPLYVRVMCGMVLQAKENDYVLALRSTGASHTHILFTHVLPNCIQPFIVLVTMQLGSVVLAEAGLSFLGIGISPPGPPGGHGQRRTGVPAQRPPAFLGSGSRTHGPRLLLQPGGRRTEMRSTRG